VLAPRVLSFDVFGTLTNNWDGSIGVFRSILRDCGGEHIDARQFQGYWEERNISHYREPYRRYREIAETSLGEAFDHFGVHGRPELIQRYFDSFSGFELYPDVPPTLETLSRRFKLAVVSNIDDDLFGATPLGREFDLVCTAERARGYKPDGTLFRYLIGHAGVTKDEIFHSGQSQFTDMVGAKPLGLTVAWINRRNLALHASVPKPDYIFSNLAPLIPLLEP
jgi:2-haloacid dehalogenase